MSIADLQEQARAEWVAQYQGSTPNVLVGSATCGRAAGAQAVVEAFRHELRQRGLRARVTETGCAGLCYAEPLVIIIKPDMPPICYQKVYPEFVPRLVQGYLESDDPCFELALGTVEWTDGRLAIPELPRFNTENRLISGQCGFIDPADINHYIANGGYQALDKALSMSPEDIITEVSVAGLRGRGGAGYPTGRKWQLCRQAPGEPKYVVCNADEGDPGAFVDRLLLESNPQQVIEGMIIAGRAVGTSQGYVYIRTEYPLAMARLRTALRQAEAKRLLGHDILGKGFDFQVEVYESAGAFVCGESTALMRSIEGQRGVPRARPPHSVVSGLWGKPTVLNNVKTFAYVPVILAHGASWFAGTGSQSSGGTAVFSLAGRMTHTGTAEVPLGTTLRNLVFEVGGGPRQGKQFKAVQIGGPSGGCLPESLFDTPIDFDSLAQAGAIMGSGGVIAMDQDNCMVDTARLFLDFTQKESCGKCTFCRLGTRQMLMLMDDIVSGRGAMDYIERLASLAEKVKAGSLCNLGRTAPNPVLTTLRYFRDEYEAHILDKRCPALVCKQLIRYHIVPEKCERGCEHCVLTCPTKAVVRDDRNIKSIDQEKCSKCGTCQEVCPPEYNAVVKLTPAGNVSEQRR